MPIPRTVVAIALSLTVAAGTPAAAQDTAATAARAAVVQLREAVRSGDWTRIRAFLPDTGAWTTTVQAMVVRPDTRAYSFWRRDSELLLDSLTITVAAHGTVIVSGPFRVGGTTGFWGTVMRQDGGHWHLQCTSEQFGQRVWHSPYCFAKRT